MDKHVATPAQHPSRGSGPRQGFSLIELVLVVGIITIIGSIAVPVWTRATQHYQVDLAALRVAADVSLAQQRANNSSTSVTLNFIAGTNSYQIVGMPDHDRPTQTYTVDLSQSPYNAAVSAVNFNSGTSLTFDGYGTPLQGGSLQVSVAGRLHTLTIDPTSGRVAIQ